MRNGRDPKSAAEQVHEKLLAAREQRLISRDKVTVIEAWRARRAWIRHRDTESILERGAGEKKSFSYTLVTPCYPMLQYQDQSWQVVFLCVFVLG